MSGLLKTVAERIFDSLILVAAAITPWLRNNEKAFWEGVFNVIVATCLILAFHIVVAIHQVWSEISAKPEGHFEELQIFGADERKQKRFVEDAAPPYFRAKLLLILIVSIVLLALPTVLMRALSPEASVPPVVAPPPAAVSLHMGCNWNHIPIPIPAGGTIDVIRVHPALLTINPTFVSGGVVEEIKADDKAREWPSKSDGRWMTIPEITKAINDQHLTPTQSAFDCTITSYGAATIEEITERLIVDTTDGKRHFYPVPFDPLLQNHPYHFYVVNMCSYGVTPNLVQWEDSAMVRVMGESAKREVPVTFQKRSFPSELMLTGSSSFVWNGIESCKWGPGVQLKPQ